MKKVLLTVAGSLIGLAMFGQAMTPADSVKTIVSSWKALYKCTANPKLITIDLTDTTFQPTKDANDVIHWKKFEPQGGCASTLKTYYDKNNAGMRLDFDWTKASDPTAPNWGDKFIAYWIDKVQPKDQITGFNPFWTDSANVTGEKSVALTPGDTVKGVMVDLSDSASRYITMSYKIISGLSTPAAVPAGKVQKATYDSLNVRIDLFDVNARNTGGHSTKRTINRSVLNDNDGKYHTITFKYNHSKDWDQIASDNMAMGSGDADLNDEAQRSFSDGYQSTWYNLENGRGWGLSAKPCISGVFGFKENAKYAKKDANSYFTGDLYNVDLDAAHICGFSIMLNDGPSVSYHNQQVSIAINKLQIGNLDYQGTGYEYIIPTVPVTAIAVSGNQTITVDHSSTQLTATLSPAGTNQKAVVWSVDNASLAKINSQTGEISAIANGTVTAIATSTEGSEIVAKYPIVISGQIVRVSSIVISGGNKIVGSATNLNPTLQLFAATNKDAADTTVTWSISDTTIAKISANGLITAKKNGSVNITAKANDASKLTTTPYKVTVSGIPSVGFDGVEPKTIIQIDNTFKFEGSAKLVNVLGQTVANGVNTLDASQVAPGVYIIVVDGFAKEVIVK